MAPLNPQTRMSEKGQVVIPKQVRDRLRLHPGDPLEVVERPDGVLLRRLVVRDAGSFEAITAQIRARVSYKGPPLSIDEMSDAIGEMWAGGGPRWDL